MTKSLKPIDFQDANTSGPYYLARGLIQFNPRDFLTTFISITTGVTEPFPEMVGYMLTKLPAVKMVELLALEYPNSVRSFAVVPGVIPTDMLPKDPNSGFHAIALDKRKFLLYNSLSEFSDNALFVDTSSTCRRCLRLS